MNNRGSFWLLSGSRSGFDTAGEDATRALALGMLGNGHAVRSGLVGAYMGAQEPTLLVADDGRAEASVLAALATFGQDAALLVHGDARAYLVDREGTRTYAGLWSPVDRETALAATGYTFDPASGTYYTLRGTA